MKKLLDALFLAVLAGVTGCTLGLVAVEVFLLTKGWF